MGLSSLIPGPDDRPARLLEGADKALYEAKRAGRNRSTMGVAAHGAVAAAPASC